MKKTVLSLTFLLALSLVGGLATVQASELDTFLQPYCGVGDPTFKVENVLRDHASEIYARSTGFQVLEVTAQNEALMWYLGALTDADSRQLAESVVRLGAPSFRRKVMGAVSARPDWTGLRIVAIGGSDVEEETRDSAASILADTDYTVLSQSGTKIANLRSEIVTKLQAQIKVETNPRLRGNFETALRKINALPAVTN
jgi:hypothetical protein